jgi:predicted TIM-barrel fold metal-dependent hydrolase
MLLQDYRPLAKLVTRISPVREPRFPVIDAHNHLADPFGRGWDRRPLSQLLDTLDEAGVVQVVDLDGGWGEDILARHLDLFKARAADRFHVFGGVDWGRWKVLGDQFPEWAAGRLRVQKDRGAAGLKIWKAFGLSVMDHEGRVAEANDPRLDPIWQTAGQLHMPVLIHVGDPVAFFDPIDERNERWEELQQHPDWSFPSPPYPAFERIMNAFLDLVKRHPGTLFIGAHVGCYAENLEWVGQMLDACPNYRIDISARVGELGRQPYSARRFCIQYQDRILFGLDGGPDAAEYQVSYRFLETDDEYFNYSTGEIPLQGRWFVSGIHLPDEVLEKVYSQNARSVLGIG